MVLDRALEFQESELNFANAPPAHPAIPAPATVPEAAKNALGSKRPR
jgi:hypothetical protein